jgi:hypothetical protein
MINDNLITELKLYIKEHYKLVSFSGLVPAKGRGKKPGIATKAQGIRGKEFDEISDLMTDFVKKNRKLDTFAYALEKIREEKGMSPAKLYKAAWIDKRLYSKIMSTANYKPAKNTAIAFGFALKLNSDEFTVFLGNAGFALSDSSLFDLVIRFCVEKEIFDLHDVNALLVQADQKVLCKEGVYSNA